MSLVCVSVCDHPMITVFEQSCVDFVRLSTFSVLPTPVSPGKTYKNNKDHIFFKDHKTDL